MTCKNKTMTSLPKTWGPTYIQIWSKMQILESYAEFESFCSKCIGVALEPIVELHTF